MAPKELTPKRRRIILVCLIILAISMAVLAVSTIIQIIHNGWETVSVVNFVPFMGMASVMIAVLASDKKRGDK